MQKSVYNAPLATESTMALTTFLSPDNIRQGVFVSSKKRALEMVGKLVADYINRQSDQESEATDSVCAMECFANLFKREKLGSTAINNGVALPHAKLPPNSCLTLEKPIAVCLQLETPIDYEASDNKAVDLIYAVLFPDQCCDQYRSELQQIARQLSDKALLKHLRAAQSAQDMWQVLVYADQTADSEQP